MIIDSNDTRRLCPKSDCIQSETMLAGLAEIICPAMAGLTVPVRLPW